MKASSRGIHSLVRDRQLKSVNERVYTCRVIWDFFFFPDGEEQGIREIEMPEMDLNKVGGMGVGLGSRVVLQWPVKVTTVMRFVMSELNLDKVWGGPGGRGKPGEPERVGGMEECSLCD